jgi:hypothetical protein
MGPSDTHQRSQAGDDVELTLWRELDEREEIVSRSMLRCSASVTDRVKGLIDRGRLRPAAREMDQGRLEPPRDGV